MSSTTDDIKRTIARGARRPKFSGLATALLASVAFSAGVHAQPAPAAPAAPAAPPAAAPAAPAAPAPAAPVAAPAAVTAPAAPAAPPAAAAPATAATPAAPAVDEAPTSIGIREQRLKPLQLSVGATPSSLDLGSEADILGVRDQREMAAVLDRWAFSMKGSLRIPIRLGFGPSNDGQGRTEVHSLPRIVGLGSGDWNYVGLAPNASATLTFTVGNPVVSGTIVMGTSHLWDASYPVIDDIGLDQAYLTFKFPSAFGRRGGIALLAGIFSERYGMAGPYQKSSGYYSTYLFGRTHQAGESLTVNLDLTNDLELILQNGIGAKHEVVPFLSNDIRAGDGPYEQDFFPGQQSQPYGSTFMHHTHAAILYSDWLRVSANYLVSWTPDDNHVVPDGLRLPNNGARRGMMSVMGGDVHVDKELVNAYLGYSRVDAKNLYPLGDAVQVIHSGSGRAFKLNYFGQKERFGTNTPDYFGGTVDTVLAQFMLRIAPLIGDPFGSRDMNLALYGMYNHAYAPGDQNDWISSPDLKDDKLKFGADLDISVLKFMSIGSRFDRVIPRLADTSDAWTAVTPRVTFYTRWKSKETVSVAYTHFFLGPRTVPGSPYSDFYYVPDPDMLVVMGRISF